MANKKKMQTQCQKKFKPGTDIPAQSGYEIKYCQILIDHGKKGHSWAEFCADIGKCDETARQWRKKYPEFKEAYNEFMIRSKAWWNSLAQANIITYFDAKEGGSRFDTNLFKFITGGRFGMSHQPDIDLPELESGSLDKKHATAIKALARGQITPNQAATISSMLKDAMDIRANEEFAEKLTEIERKLETMQYQKVVSKVAEEPEYEEVKS